MDFITQDLLRADVIALGALLVGCLSAVYARRQSVEAAKARIAATRESRRPQRLEVFRAMVEFCAFCGRYYTMYLMNATKGTRDLVSEIESLRWQMEQRGPLEMPDVAAEIKALESMAWRLQRHLDRLGSQAAVVQSGTTARADEIAVQELSDTFATKRNSLQQVFAPYLNDA